jgi:lipid-A-disaccharide synthase
VSKKIMLVAGEVSGDLQGAALAKELKALNPSIQLFGNGGPKMEASGVQIKFNVLKKSTVGFLEAISQIIPMLSILKKLKKIIVQENPDTIVLIDNQGFNLQLAKFAQERNIPTVYYFTPQAWIWGSARQVARRVTRLIGTFPLETEVYKNAGADITFVGHPLLDLVKPTMSKEEARKKFGLEPNKPVISILPGSRLQEIRYHLPVMLEAVTKIKERKEVQFLLSLASPIFREEYNRGVRSPHLTNSADIQEVKIVEEYTYDLLNVSDLVLTCSGTATLEAACLGKPMVIVYKLAFLSYLFARMLIRLPYVSMPNIIAGRKIAPELIQKDFTPTKLAQAALNLLNNPEEMERMKEDLGEVVQKLGQPGAVRRAAQIVLDTAAEGSADHQGVRS